MVVLRRGGPKEEKIDMDGHGHGHGFRTKWMERLVRTT